MLLLSALLSGELPVDELPVRSVDLLLVLDHVNTVPVIEAQLGGTLGTPGVGRLSLLADAVRSGIPAGEDGEHGVAGGDVELIAAVIKVIENTDAAVTGAEAVVQAVINVLGIADALLNQIQAGSPQCKLEVVANEARVGLFQDGGLSVKLCENLLCIVNNAVCGLLGVADLEVGNHVNREEGMGDDDAVGIFVGSGCESIGKNGGGAGADELDVGAAALDFCKADLLHFDVFSNGFENDFALGHAFVRAGVDQIGSADFFLLFGDNTLSDELVVHLVKTGLIGGDFSFVSDVADGLVAVEGGQNSGAVADHAKADNTDNTLIHVYVSLVVYVTQALPRTLPLGFSWGMQSISRASSGVATSMSSSWMMRTQRSTSSALLLASLL